MSDAMMRAVEDTHMGLLRHIKGKQAWNQVDRAWETPEVEELLR